MTGALESKTYAEILNQPRCWRETFESLRLQDWFAATLRSFPGPDEWLFVGCGSSHHVAQVAAATWNQLFQVPARALPASELLLYPRIALAGADNIQPVLISRSGQSSELLQACEFLKSRFRARPLGIVCQPDSELETVAASTLTLADANDQGVVVTQAFTTPLLVLQALGAARAGQAAITSMIQSLADFVEGSLPAWSDQFRDIARLLRPQKIVALGQGPYYGLAQEAALKITEMSATPVQYFYTLEYRHGPIAACDADTLVLFFLSEDGYAAERRVWEDVKALGAATIVITSASDDHFRGSSNYLVEMDLKIPDAFRAAAAAVPVQLLGYFLARKKGLNPDQPLHLSRAVILSARD